MERKFTAFISYRHLPLDAAVAKRLHRLIERYRVPKDVRSRPEQKRLGLVFRDQEELPLSSDLTQDIYTALDNSDFLIVVCTPDTPKSLWVDREIRYFLKTHGRNRILTVLAAGTVEESVPKAITHIYAEDGETVLDRIEPLCANLTNEHGWKGMWKLRKEYLRLVAALLNCAYDDLRQRQKQYRLQQMLLLCGIVAIAAMGIAALVVNKNAQISSQNQQIQQQNLQISQQNEQILQQLRQTQLNESQALTLISQTKLEHGDRAGAIRYAMDALPTAGNDRPYYAPARLALTDALGMYKNEQPTYRLDAQLHQETDIQQIALSDDGKYAATYSQGTVRLFALPSCKELWSFSSQVYLGGSDDAGFQSFYFLPQRNALLYVGDGYDYVLSLEDGRVLDSADYDGYLHNMLDISPDKTQFAAYCGGLHLNGMNTSSFIPAAHSMQEVDGAYNADGSVFALTSFRTFFSDQQNDFASEITLFLIDTSTGEQKNQVLVDRWGEVKASSLRITALPGEGFLLSYRYSGIMHVHHVSNDGEILSSNSFTEKGTLLDAQQVGDQVRYVFSDPYDYRPEAEQYMIAIDSRDCTIAWEFNFPESRTFCFQNSAGTLILKDEYDSFYRYECSESDDLSSADIWNYSWTAKKVFWCENSPDTVAIINSDEPDCAHIIRRTPPEDVQILSAEITLSYDGAEIYISPTGRTAFFSGSFRGGNGMSSARSYKSEVPELWIYKTDSFVDRVGANGFTSDESKLFSSDGRLYDLETGDVLIPRGWEESGADVYRGDVCSSVSWNDRIPGMPNISAVYNGGTLHWWVDGENYASSENPYPAPEDISFYRHVLVGQNGLVLIRPSEYTVPYSKVESLPYLLFDTAAGVWHQIPIQSGIPGYAPACLGREQPLFASADPDSILRIWDVSIDSVIREIPLSSPGAVNHMMFLKHDSILLIMQEYRRFTLIDVQTGELLSQFNGDEESWGNLNIRQDPDEKYLFIGYSCGTYTGMILEMDSFSVAARVPGLISYLPCSDKLLCLSEDRQHLLMRSVYSLEELMELGSHFLS